MKTNDKLAIVNSRIENLEVQRYNTLLDIALLEGTKFVDDLKELAEKVKLQDTSLERLRKIQEDLKKGE